MPPMPNQPSRRKKKPNKNKPKPNKKKPKPNKKKPNKNTPTKNKPNKNTPTKKTSNKTPLTQLQQDEQRRQHHLIQQHNQRTSTCASEPWRSRITTNEWVACEQYGRLRFPHKSDRKDRQLYDFGMPLKNPILTTHAKERANERGIAWGDRAAMRFVKGTNRNLVATMYHWER
jgi:hypothetical protein